MKHSNYKLIQGRKNILLGGLFLFMLISGVSFTSIYTEPSIWDIPMILLKWYEGVTLTGQEKIILYMRLPSVCMAVIVGMGLAVSGAVMQSITHNDLVSPFTMGVSSAAAFGASICIISGNTFLHSNMGVIAGAFLSSCICVLLVYGFSMSKESRASYLVLTGIAMSYFFSALTATVQFFAQEYKLAEIVQWTFGSLNKATWVSVGISFYILVMAIGIFYIWGLSLDAMANNDDEMVKSLGIDPRRVRFIIGLTAVFLTAAIVSFTGVIGFVGLVAPHMARILIGNEHRVFLPMAACLGAVLLLYSDMIGRYLLYPVIIPVGIIISFIGVPLFIHLIRTAGKRGV